jgi:hypothetical protein
MPVCSISRAAAVAAPVLLAARCMRSAALSW